MFLLKSFLSCLRSIVSLSLSSSLCPSLVCQCQVAVLDSLTSGLLFSDLYVLGYVLMMYPLLLSKSPEWVPPVQVSNVTICCLSSGESSSKKSVYLYLPHPCLTLSDARINLSSVPMPLTSSLCPSDCPISITRLSESMCQLTQISEAQGLCPRMSHWCEVSTPSSSDVVATILMSKLFLPVQVKSSFRTT